MDGDGIKVMGEFSDKNVSQSRLNGMICWKKVDCVFAPLQSGVYVSVISKTFCSIGIYKLIQKLLFFYFKLISKIFIKTSRSIEYVIPLLHKFIFTNPLVFNQERLERMIWNLQSCSRRLKWISCHPCLCRHNWVLQKCSDDDDLSVLENFLAAKLSSMALKWRDACGRVQQASAGNSWKCTETKWFIKVGKRGVDNEKESRAECN